MLVLPQPLGWVAKTVMDLASKLSINFINLYFTQDLQKEAKTWVDCLSPPHSSSLACVSLPPFPLFQDASL